MRDAAKTFAVGILTVLAASGVVWLVDRWPLIFAVLAIVFFVYIIGAAIRWIIHV